jgi:predicted transcriptional regulator of viral defense system
MKLDELTPFKGRTFSIEELENYFKEPVRSIRVQLSRLCKSGKLIRLKQNRYTFPDAHPNVYVMAHEMVSPSYHSLESALSLHGIIPEGTVAYTLITSKKTQKYSNEFGTFSYRHLPPHLFFGVEKRADSAFMATPEKAILDYLYLNSAKFKPDFALWQAERLDELETLDWKLMNKWAKKYGMKKLVKLVKSLKDYVSSEHYQEHK